MSVITPPAQQGPAPTNTQTRIHNNTLKIASVGGGQNAVYHVVGGPITDNVNLNLPPLAADDTVATLGQNNNWTGVHNFGAGLNSQGPINTTGSINANGPITTNDAIVSTGGITSIGPLTAQGNFNAANLVTPGTLSVGTTATITGNATMAGTLGVTGALTSGSHTVNGTHTVTSTSSLQAVQATTHTTTVAHNSQGSFIHTGSSLEISPRSSGVYVAGSNGQLALTNDTGGITDNSIFGIHTGATNGLMLGNASNADRVAFLNGSSWTSNVPLRKGASLGTGIVSSDGTWTAKNQSMLNTCYANMLGFGFLHD